MKMENFKQVNTLDELNALNIDDEWTFSEGLTRYFNKPTFKKRQRKK